MDEIKIAIINSWTSEEQLRDELGRHQPPNSKITIVRSDEVYDYLLIINADHRRHPSHYGGRDNVLYFCMEPRLPIQMGDWSRAEKYFDAQQLYTHPFEHNLVEFHMNKTYEELSESPQKLGTYISIIQSPKRDDIGQKKRLDFVLALNRHLARVSFDSKDGAPTVESPLHCYGTFQHNSLVNSFGMLPYKMKELGLEKYKYHFTAENNSIPNYFTEKIVDGILMECLVFYWGCPNLEEYLPAESFVRLELEDLDADCALVERAMKENWRAARLPAIKEAKRRILTELAFFPHVASILRKRRLRARPI